MDTGFVFFFPVVRHATGSLIRMHSQIELAELVRSCMQLVEVSRGEKSESVLCVCVGDCLF